MRRVTGSGRLVRMHGSHNVRVILDLDADGETIRGSISKADEGSRPFFGWLELAGALEAARRRGSEPRPDVSAQARSSRRLGSR